MKKPKFLFKVDHNNHGKVYINHKWLHDVTEINIHGEPLNYSILVERYKRNSDGTYLVMNNEIQRYTTSYYIGSLSNAYENDVR